MLPQSPQITNLTDESLSSEFEAILQLMFVGYLEVKVKTKFTRGLGGSSVFLVRPQRKEGFSELPTVVKIDQKERIQQEIDSYDSYIRDRLPYVAEIKSSMVALPEADMGGLRYPLVGAGTFEIESLKEYYGHNTPETICGILEKRLFPSLHNLWAQRTLYPDFLFRTFYDSFLPVNLVLENIQNDENISNHLKPETINHQRYIDDILKISGFRVVRKLEDKQALILDLPQGGYRLQVQSVPNFATYQIKDILVTPLVGKVILTRDSYLREQVIKFVGHTLNLADEVLSPRSGFSVPNPLVALNDVLNQTLDVYIACIHADLNLENVLIESQNGNPYLIDFVNSRQDHVLRDLFHLEMAIVAQLLPEAITKTGQSPEVIISFYERLHCAVLRPDQVDSPPGLEKPFKILLTIRNAARHYLMKREHWEEYYDGLFCYLLGSLRYSSLDSIPVAKPLAFWAAAAARKLSQGFSACDQFLKTQPGSTQQLISPSDKKQKDSSKNVDTNQTNFHGSVMGPVHTGSGDIYIGSDKPKPYEPKSVRLSLDVAVPNIVYIERSFDVGVFVRQSTSPERYDATLPHIISEVVKPLWPESLPYISLQTRLTVDDEHCAIIERKEFSFSLNQGDDSPPLFFVLKPKKSGEISLIVTVHQENILVGSGRCRMTIQNNTENKNQGGNDSPGKHLGINIQNLSLQKRSQLRLQIESYFNDSELRNLYFDMGIDHENLSSGGKSDKVRELVAACERHGKIRQLIELCREYRPYVNWPDMLVERDPYPHDDFAKYRSGIQQLLSRMGQNHLRFLETLTYQKQLEQNIIDTQRDGDTQTHRSERSEILERLNEVSISTLRVHFKELCQ